MLVALASCIGLPTAMRRLALAALLTAVLGALLTSGATTATSAKPPRLFATNRDYGDRWFGPSIRRSSYRGALVRRLTAGTYRIRLHDSSRDADFELSGPGVELKTSYEYIGIRLWTVRLEAGVYRYRRRARERGTILPPPEGLRGRTIRVVARRR